MISSTEFINRYPKKRQRILVSGATGLVGTHLTAFLEDAGHDVWTLTRDPAKMNAKAIYWDPKIGHLDARDFENFDAMILLAGKNIADNRWSKKVKEEILLSRARDNWLLSHALLRLEHQPKTIICASAIGFYGNREGQLLTESSPRGKGFLAEVCHKWEDSTNCIEEKGTRGVHARFGVVLSPKGGMLAKMIPLFRNGLGAILGSGEQYISWIALEDVVYSIYHILLTPGLSGPINMTAPNPETNAHFSEKLADAFHRKVFLRVPRIVLNILFGKEMTAELFLSSAKAVPEKLVSSGYSFLYPSLESYFKQLS